ncbi:MAG: hypothetical protein LUG16_05235, partial [Candidatus Gastranaerophilales bacterium]|nr:hypothetical protein [Candidatus Gastranaerophilales bacterium]
NEIKTMINNEDILIADSSITDFLKDSNISCLNYENNNDNLGIYLSEIVKDRLNSNNDDFHWAKVKPLYIQPPSITKPKEYK